MNYNIFLLLLPYLTIIPGLYLFHNIWIAMVSYHTAILLIVVFGKHLKRTPVLVRGWSWKYSLIISIGCAANGFLIYYLWPFISLPGNGLAETLAKLGIHENNWLLLILYYSLVTPWLEEFYWRKLLPDKLKYPILSDIFFAGYHFFVMILFIKPLFAFVAFLSLFSAAYSWRKLEEKLGGLSVPVLSHTLADISTILAVYLLIH
jgi:membrane protease YdiL (CAAX protease family)